MIEKKIDHFYCKNCKKVYNENYNFVNGDICPECGYYSIVVVEK